MTRRRSLFVALLAMATLFVGWADVRIPPSSAFTASVWVNAREGSSEANPYPQIFQLPFGRLELVGCEGFPQVGNVLFELSVPGRAEDVRWTFSRAIAFGRWAHLALVCRGGDEGVPELYVNGKRLRAFLTPKPMRRAFPGGAVTVGHSESGDSPLPGRVADFRFEPRILTDAAIAARAAKTPDGVPPAAVTWKVHDELPLISLADETARQSVVSSGADGVYQGHPTTAVAPDGTVFCVWTINHGGACGPMAQSTDGGRTWTRCDALMPAEYRQSHRNCPTLQRITRADGGVNLAVFSATSNDWCGIVLSRDGGKTWKTAPEAKLPAMMPPTGLVMLKDGTAALFGQVRKPGVASGDGATSDQEIWMSQSRDGGGTWGEPHVVASLPDRNLCEPFAFRSPDGRELCLLLRDNRHMGRSLMCFSADEGRTWTKPADTCRGLTGDRHEGVILPDGRLFVAFRDRALGSSTYGQYVAWIGSYADLREGRPGDFRLHLLKHVGERIWDTGYSGVELLSDGAILCTTYLRYRETDRSHSVVSTRLAPTDLQTHLSANNANKRRQ